MDNPVATVFLDKITTFFTWVLARIGELVTFITSNEILTYMIGIVFLSFAVGLLIRLIRNRA